MVAPMSVSPVLASVTVPLMVCWAQSVLHKRQKANGRRSLILIRDELIIMSFLAGLNYIRSSGLTCAPGSLSHWEG